MSSSNWGPSPFERFKQEMERWLDTARTSGERAVDVINNTVANCTGLPEADLIDTPEALTLYVDLPGITPQHVDVQLVGNILKVVAHRELPSQLPDAKRLLSERYSKDFRRDFTLPFEVESNGIVATVRDGVLTVRMPKAPQPTSRTIPVG